MLERLFAVFVPTLETYLELMNVMIVSCMIASENKTLNQSIKKILTNLHRNEQDIFVQIFS